MLKKVFTTILATCTLISSVPTFAANTEGLNESEIQEAINNFSASIDVEDGATFIAYKNTNNDVVIGEYTPEITKSLSYTPGDGVLEYAVFHLGFNNWTNSTGSLYYTITADEYLKTVAGTAYVKENTALFPDTYYEDKWYTTLNPATTTATRTLASVNVGSATKVKVGFKNVTFTTLKGEGGSFTNQSKVVYK